MLLLLRCHNNMTQKRVTSSKETVAKESHTVAHRVLSAGTTVMLSRKDNNERLSQRKER